MTTSPCRPRATGVTWGAALGQSAVVVHEKFHTNRHVALPIEGRATLAALGSDGMLTLWTSSQMPHMVRSRVTDMMGWPEHKMRVISPDVGGGFGLKCHVFSRGSTHGASRPGDGCSRKNGSKTDART